MRPFAFPGTAIFLGCVVWPLSGCGGGGGVPPPDSGPDAPVDSGMPDTFQLPDGATACASDGECSDGVMCTRDVCDPRGFCVFPVDAAVCDDGVFCNGVELCDPLRGCRSGPPESCNDDDVCSLDRCDETAKVCRHFPRDFDQDGEADWHCMGGTDCNDMDPRIGMTVSELCGDGIDNDCDTLVDEADCGRPPHDICADPLDVSAGGTFLVSNVGTVSDYSLTCGGAGRKDVVLRLTLATAQDVRIAADGTGRATLALRTTCDSRLTETDCASGVPAQIRIRSLAAGTYFVLVTDTQPGTIAITVELTPATPPPTNESCLMPADVSAGGSFMGSFVDVADDERTTCGFSLTPDLLYTFTIATSQDVRLSLLSLTGDSLSLAVRTTCTDAMSELRCVRGSPAGTTLHSLPAGTYYVVVEGSSFREVDFRFDVAFSAPTPAPAGDTCATAIPLALDTRTLGTLADKEDDLDISCGFFNRDAVYSFTLVDRRDVTVLVDAARTFMYASVRTSCADGATQLRCTSGVPSRSRLRDLGPGTYYVIVEATRGTGFDITIETTPPTMSTPVSGNENCATAHVVPVTGGLFTGNTLTMINDYQTSMCGSTAASADAVFRLDLTAMSRVVASTEGSSFDTVLHMHETVCVSGAERFCDDDGAVGLTSLLDRTLPPGTYFYVVDGFGSTNVGPYVFEVLVSPP